MTLKFCLTSSILVGLIGAGCFCSSIFGGFVFDDTEAILNNKDVSLETPWIELFKNDFWGTRLTHRDSHKSYRPLTVLSFRLNVLLSGGALEAHGFHAVNVALHALVSALTLPLFLTVFTGKHRSAAALASSLLFAVHPIHSEAVAGIVGRADLLCAFFTILSYLVYVRATACTGQLNNVILTIFSTVLTACAMLSKEQGLTILGVCCMYDVVVASGCRPGDLTNRVIGWLLTREYKDNRATGNRLLLARLIILLLAGSSLLYLRYHLMGFQIPTFSLVDNPASFAPSFITRVLNYNYIYCLNAWLLLCPDWLCFDWSMGCVPLIDPFTLDLRLLPVVVLWAALVSLLLATFQTSLSSFREVMMGLVLVAVPFVVASNLLFRVGFVVAERVLYLPSLGYCLLVTVGLRSLYLNSDRKLLLQAGFAVLLLVNAVRCYSRSLDWLNERRLFESGVRVCPLNAKVHYNLAKTSANFSEAIVHYRRALELHPEYEQAMNNLANILRDNGNTGEAEKLLKQAILIRPNFPAAWMNLGIVLANTGRYDEALEAYNTALSYRRIYPDCHYNLGNLFLSQKKYNEAYYAWRKATSQKSNHAVAWNNMIVMLDSLGELPRAEKLGLEALRFLPEDSSIHFNLGNIMGKQQKFKQAEFYFNRAISLKPGSALYHTNLGVLYHRWKKYNEAETHYALALSLNPNSTNAYHNLKIVKRFL